MVTLILAMAGAAAPARGQCERQEDFKLTASDAAEADHFGTSVAISGDTAVAGAPDDDHASGTGAGSAYVFVRTGGVWVQQAWLTASDAQAGDGFGLSVAASGDTIVIGAWDAAYVFVRAGTVWMQQAILIPSAAAPGDVFGAAVSISGDTVLLGADHQPVTGQTFAGSAYVFVRSGGFWSEQAMLTASDAAAFDYFGDTVAIFGDTVVIGAYGDDDRAPEAGSAYVFVRVGNVWTQQAKLTALDGVTNDFFGNSVSISGDTVVVGAWLDDHVGGPDPGSAYVFVRSGGVWTQQTKLTASDASAGANFGRSVSISGDTAVVGIRGVFTRSAYVFVRSGGVWTQQAKLTASDAASVGYSVSVSGDTAVVGAYQDDHAGGNDAGSAYVFIGECGSEEWCGPATPTAPMATPGTIGCGQTSTLSASVPSGVTVDWFTGSCGGTPVPGGATPTVSPTATTTYYARARRTATGCVSETCATTTTVTVIPISAPSSPSAMPATICVDEVSTLSASVPGGVTIDWYIGSCGGAQVGSGTPVFVAPSTTTTFYARARDTATGCESAACAQVTVTVNALPATPASPQAAPSTICSGASSTLSANVPGGVTVDWYTGDCIGGTLVPGGATPTVSPTTTTTYYARARNTTTGCQSATCAQVTVTVNPLPAAPANPQAAPSTICLGSSSTLAATVPGGVTVDWYSGSCGGAFVGSGSAIAVSPATTTTYYARARDLSTACASGGCAAVTVTVTGMPQPPTSANVNRNNFCANDSGTISLTATGGSGVTLNWYADSCGGTSIGQGTPLVIPSPTQTTTYYARWESPPCAPSTCAGVTVTVRAVPVAPASAMVDRNNFCANDPGTITLTASGGSGGTLTWYAGSCGGGGSIGAGSPLIIPSPAVTTTYYARWENLPCTPSTCANVTVTVLPVPVAPASAMVDRSPFCASDPGNIMLTANGGSGEVLRWYSGSCGGTFVGNGTPLTIASPTQTTTYYARWESTNCGNSSCASVTVSVYPAPVITQQPSSRVFCPDEAVVLTVAANGVAPVSYRWRKNGVNLSDGGNISGATTATLTIDPTGAADAGTYDVVVTDACGSATSDPVQLIENRLEVTGYAGGSPDFDLTTGGTTVTFAGQFFVSGMSVIFTNGLYSAAVPPGSVVAGPDGTQLTVTVPPFAPGCDCADGQPIFVNVLFDNGCTQVDLLASGLAFTYYPFLRFIPSVTGVQAAITAAAPGECLVLVTRPQNYVGTWTIGNTKYALTLTSNLADPGKTQVDGEGTAGGPPPPNPTLRLNGHGPGVCVSYLNFRLGNTGVEVNNASPVIKSCLIDDNSADAARGGGMTILNNANPLVVDTTVTINRTLGNGGGVRIDNSSPTVVGSTISGNIMTGFGGGLFLNNTPNGVVVADCTIRENQSRPPAAPARAISGGGVYWTGGTQAQPSVGLLARNDIFNNESDDDGAGIWLDRNIIPLIANNLIRENRCMTKTGWGGGIFVRDDNRNAFSICGNVIVGNEAQVGGALVLLAKAEALATYNLIYCNRAVQLDPELIELYYAAGVYVYDAGPWINHNTIFRNTGAAMSMQSIESGGIHLSQPGTGSPQFRSNIFERNGDYEMFSDTSYNVFNRLSYCLAYDPADPSRIFSPTLVAAGPGNIIGQDPLFVAEPAACPGPFGTPTDLTTAFAPFHLQAGSLARNAAHDSEDIGAVPFDAFDPLTCVTPSEDDCNGNGLPDQADILAELSTDANLNGVPDECEALPRADFDGDGDVDLDDFAILDGCLQGPGVAYPPGCDAADLDEDGDVDLVDSAAFFAAFTG